MTDQEIWEKYRDKIINTVEQFFIRLNIQDPDEKQYLAAVYPEEFIEGVEEGKKALARKLLAKGMSMKDVAELTNLSLEVMRALLH